MKVYINYGELSKIGKYLKEKDSSIEETLNEINGLFEQVRTCWKGMDSENFITNSTNYIKEQQEKRKHIGQLGNLISKISSGYENNDKEWAEEMHKERREVFDEH